MTSRAVIASLFALLCVAGPLAVSAGGAAPIGSWRPVEIDGRPAVVEASLDLGADGAVSGIGGCNHYGGRAEITGSAIRFGVLMRTEMACPEPRMSEENRFHRALERVTGWRVDGDVLLLSGRGGETLVRFTRRG